MELVRGAAVRSGMVLSCVLPGSIEPSNKGMKQTKLVAAPWKRSAVPPRAFRRFAAVRTASQLIPGVGRTVASATKPPAQPACRVSNRVFYMRTAGDARLLVGFMLPEA